MDLRYSMKQTRWKIPYSGITLIIFCASYVFISENCVLAQTVTGGCVNDQVSVDCSGTIDCFIDIHGSWYGNALTSADTCTWAPSHCTRNATDVWQHCSGKKSCDFYIREERLDKCSAVSQYLFLNYTCRCSVSCVAFTSHDNEQIRYSQPYLTIGATATFSCNSGYTLVGPETRTCRKDNTWSGISPECSVTAEACPHSDFPMQPFGYDCFELVKEVHNWDGAVAYCAKRNGSLVTADNTRSLNFLTWWLNKLDFVRYVWLHTRTDRDKGSPRECAELYKDSPYENWLPRVANCAYRNQFVCRYDVSIEANNTYDRSNFERNLAIGLTFGMALPVIIATAVVVIFVLMRVRRMKREEGTDSEEPVVECVNISVEPGDSAANSDYMNYGESSKPYYTQVVKKSPTNSDIYDEVYVVPHEGDDPEHGPGEERKCPQRTSSLYENVTLHYLSESLKRKFLPRRMSVKNKSKAPNGSSHRAKQPPPVPKKNFNISTYKNDSVTESEAVNVNSAYDGEETANRNSSGIDIVENELYHPGDLE